jgi:hypothetical protein
MPLGEHLTRDELDRAARGRPVWLTHFTVRATVVGGQVSHDDSGLFSRAGLPAWTGIPLRAERPSGAR